MAEETLRVENLRVEIPTLRGIIHPVDDVSLTVAEGSVVGLVGESGCGKTMIARAVMDLMRRPARVAGGRILLAGRDLRLLSAKERRALRGAEVSMIFQEPMTSLNPLMKIGRQVDEAVLLHTGLTRAQARRRTLEMLEAVGIADPEKRAACYPHQLSGGMRQRVMIAMAMICQPRLLIADEPTTALDVAVQAQILLLMQKLCAGGTSVLLISHNLGVIAQLCDRVYVMYAGRMVEYADAHTLFTRPLHPYTRGLLRSVASMREGAATLETIPGVVPNLLHLPSGCAFSLRCDACAEGCKKEKPRLQEAAPGHGVCCFQAGAVSADPVS